ncbi:MAG TPA: hypothetical protein VKU41_04455, partial [Polyangiaceae bacterium]|nr:hypothetical protein [Polyangiaceae bacterium]
MKWVRWRRVVAGVLGTVVALAASYLVVANVLLRTRLLRDAIGGSSLNFAFSGSFSEVRLEYKSAYSILPGRVHVEGLTIRGRDRAVEWFLSVDRTDVAISLVDLLHRTLRATRVRSSGLAIRARLRLSRENATPIVVAALPSIPGFADPPFLDDGPAPPPRTDTTYNLWSVDLEDVDVEHVREVWIHVGRSEGESRVRGRWLFRPQRWLDVGPAMVEANGVDLFYGRHPLATGLRGSMRITMHPFDLREAKGLAIFDHASYRGELRGKAIFAEALGLLAPRSGVTFTSCDSAVDARIVVDHGKLADGTRVHTEATDCELEAEGRAFAGPVRTDLGVEGDLATVAARVSGARVTRLGIQEARVASIVATAVSHRVRLGQFFDDARFVLDMGGAETSDVGLWTHLLPSASTVVVRSGPVTASGHASGSLPGAWAVGSANVAAEDVVALLGPVVVTGNVAVHVDLRRGTWEGRRADLSGSHAALHDGRVRSARSGAAVLVAASLTAVAPRFTLTPSGVDGQASIDLPRADLVDLRGLRELLSLPAGLTIEGGTARTKMHADIEMGGAMRAEGEVVANGVRARVRSTEFYGDLDLSVKAHGVGGARGWIDLSGSTLAIRHAGTGTAASPEDPWWGDLALREATLRTTGSLRFDAKVNVAAKNATPATVFLFENMGVPAWAANVLRMPALEAEAEVRVAPSSFELRSFAHGGGTSVRTEYANRGERHVGAVLVDLGWIDLGYDLTEGETGLVVFGPQGWFGRKTAAMHDAAQAARREADAAEQLVHYAAMTPASRKDEARMLAARCTLEMQSCDGASIDDLLHTAADASERDTLSGIAYAPMVVAAAGGGTDGT